MFRFLLKQSTNVVRHEFRLYSTDYAAKFTSAQIEVKKLKEEPENTIKLKLYALFKQATSGDVFGSQPSKLNFIERAKYDAWASVKGITNEDAQKQYIDLVNKLKAEDGPSEPESSSNVSGGVEGLKISIIGGVMTLELNRPKKFNALTIDMYNGIMEALTEADRNNDVKLVVFTGVGDYYCSGNDLSNFELAAKIGKEKLAEITYEVYVKFVKAFIDVQKPLVALVNGPAVGISVTTLPLFSLVLASEKATFHTPFATLGQTAEGCSTVTFPSLMGRLKASEVLVFSKKLTAQEAYERNLVNVVLPAVSFREEANKRVAELAKLPPNTMRINATLLKDPIREQLNTALIHEAKALKQSWLSKECEEALMKFMKRK